MQKYHHPYVAHTLNLCVHDTITGITTLGTLLKKYRSVVEYFRRSAEAAEALKSTQKQMNCALLKQDVHTRWNSVFFYGK